MELLQEVETAERVVQAKRQDYQSQQQSQQAFKAELDVLRNESVASATDLQKLLSEQKNIENELVNKMSQLKSSQSRCDAIKKRLEEEKQITGTKEQGAIQVENFLEERTKELKQSNVHLQSLKDQMYKDSQHLASLRQKEAKFIMDIKNSQVSHTHMM